MCEVAELCRTQANILNPSSIEHFASLKYKQNPLCQVLASICRQKKSQSWSSKIFPKIGFKATNSLFLNLIVSRNKR